MLRAAAAALALALLAGCLGATDAPAPDPARPDLVAFAGAGCDAGSVQVPVDAAAARAVVPAGYVVAAPAGRAVLVVNAVHCREFSVDGEPAGPVRVSEAGIEIESPDGSPGTSTYLLWQVADRAPYGAALEAFGIAGGIVPGIAFSRTTGAGFGDVEAEVPRPTEGYGVSVMAATPALPTEGSNVWWHDGERGRLRMSVQIAGTFAAGQGVTYGESGSTIEALLGDAQGEGAGFVGLFDITGRVELA